MAACALAFFATTAVAEKTVIDDPVIQYSYTYNTIGSQHFCDLATVMWIMWKKVPMEIKLTAAFILDDTKPKDKNLSVMYVVEALDARAKKNVKVIGSRIISDVFDSNLNASKLIDNQGAAAYAITAEGSLALFENLMTAPRAYALAIEFENNANLTINVKPTPEFFGPSAKWLECSVAITKDRPPQ